MFTEYLRRHKEQQRKKDLERIKKRLYFYAPKCGRLHFNDMNPHLKELAHYIKDFIQDYPSYTDIFIKWFSFRTIIPTDPVEAWDSPPPSELQIKTFLCLLDRYLSELKQTPDLIDFRKAILSKYDVDLNHSSIYFALYYCQIHLPDPSYIALQWDRTSLMQTEEERANSKVIKNFSNTVRPSYLTTVNQAANFMIEELGNSGITTAEGLNVILSQLALCKTQHNFLLKALYSQTNYYLAHNKKASTSCLPLFRIELQRILGVETTKTCELPRPRYQP